MKNKVARFQIILVVLIAFAAGYFFGVNKVNLAWKSYSPSLQVVGKEPPTNLSNVDFSQFWITWQKLEATYYDKSKLDPQQMVNAAISGMVQSLGDPFTIYLPPVQNDNFKQGMAGQFTGIGAELGMRDDAITVIAPLVGSPAERSGIKAGDKILRVDDELIAGWSLSQAVEKIRGPKGTEVVLQVLHKDAKDVSDIKIIRDVITIKSVEGWVKEIAEVDEIESVKDKEGEVAYIRLSQFGDNTNKDWLDVVNDLNLKISLSANFKGIILDLRNNPGGYLTDAVFIASEFLNQKDTVVSEEGGSREKTMLVERKGLFINLPLVILINGGSASASEIVAGALRDNRQIKLIGEKSFGKGTIQQAEDLGAGAGLHVTVAKWLTPKGTWVNEKGLEPDIKVDFDSELYQKSGIDTQLERAVEELLK